jgi:anti-sigma factor RsiW
VIGRAHHLREERLVDCYVAERHGDSIDPPLAEHLADCDECKTRYAELVRFLDSVREEANAETDEIFTPERLGAQQRQIARRLEHVGRPARVISFPGKIVGRRMSPSAASGRTRWIYAAAAAGLAIGLGFGAAYQADWRAFHRAPGTLARIRQTAARQSTAERPGVFVPIATAGDSPVPDASDDAFLSDLDLALERPRTRELQPFDAFTPHVREIRDNLR